MADDQLEKKDKLTTNDIIARYIIPVLIPLTVALILYLSPTALQYFKSFLAFIWWLIFEKHLIAGWIIIILLGLSLFSLYVIGRGLLNQRAHIKIYAFRDRYYIQDFIFGTLWRWSFTEDNKMANLTSFCPKCEAETICINQAQELVYLRCNHCGFRSQNITASSTTELMELTRQHITRKIRTHEWIAIAKQNRKLFREQNTKSLAQIDSED